MFYLKTNDTIKQPSSYPHYFQFSDNGIINIPSLFQVQDGKQSSLYPPHDGAGVVPTVRVPRHIFRLHKTAQVDAK